MSGKKVGLCHRQSPLSRYDTPGLRQRAVDGAERVADLGSEQAHDRDHDDGDEGENDRILNQTLTFFLRSE